MKRLFILLSFIISYLSFSPAGAQSGYGTGDGFNPESPDIPGAGGLYLDKGLVIIDGLKGGGYEAIDEAIYAIWRHYCDEQGYGEYSSERDSENMLEVFSRIKTVIVCADMGNELEYYGIADDIGRYFREMTVLDLSRTTGWTADYGLSDEEYLSNLEILFLPDCVEEIPSMAGLQNLSDVYCYAELPPTLYKDSWAGDELFANAVKVKVHVPDHAIDLYKSSDVWGKYEIVGIENTVGKMEVKMPQGVDGAQYRNMWLTLTDESTQLMTRYVITDRKSYFFPGINGEDDITYAVAMENRFGTTVCQEKGIRPDPGLTLVQLKNPKPVVTATVKNATDDMTLTWYDAAGDRITSSKTLAGLVPGDVVSFDVKMPPVNGIGYAPLPRQTVTIPAYASGDYPIYLDLQPRKKHTFVGFVRDASTGLPLHEISVTKIQNEEGLNDCSTSYSYSDGRFIVTAFDGPLKISLASKEYLRKDIDMFVTSDMPESNNMIGDYTLQRANAKIINLDFSQTVADVGQYGATYSYFHEPQDVVVKVYNESQDGVRLNNVSVQYPQVLVLDGAEDGDELRLEFSSVSDAFDAFSLTTTLEDGSATVEANIIEKGGFSSIFRTTQNGSVVAIVYDSEGRYVNYYLHQKATLNVSGLSEGDYTLVTMGYDPVMSQLTTLQAFEEVGLQPGIDYLQQDFHVSPGILTVIEQDEVPVINLEDLKIIHPSTTFSVSKSTVTLGDYITVRARVKVKNEIAQNSWNYDDFRLLFDLPENCTYLKGSLMVDGVTVEDPSYEGSRLKIWANGIEEGKLIDVRFCLVCKKEGQQQVSAFVGYHHYDWQNGDADFFSPVGSSVFTVIPMDYTITSATTGNLVAVGNGPRGATVSAYDNDALVAQTTIEGDSWSLNAELPQSYNLSIHPIHLECVTKENVVYNTPVTYVRVNRDMNTVSKVTMLYPNAYSHETSICTWDFINPDTKVETYDFYPESLDFTFLIDFLRNDTTEIGDVVLEVEFGNGKTQEINAVFDEGRSCWVAPLTMSYLMSSHPPVDVAVGFNNKKPVARGDRERLASEQEELTQFIGEINTLIAIMEGANEQNINQKLTDFEAALGAPLMGAMSDETKQWIQSYSTMSEEESERAIDELLAECEEASDELSEMLSSLQTELPLNPDGSYTLSDGARMFIKDCSDYQENTLEAQGFELVKMTDGSTVYLLQGEDRCVMVDFATGTAMELLLPPASAGPRRSIMDYVTEAIQETANIADKVVGLMGTFISQVGSKIESIERSLWTLENHIERLESVIADPNTPIWKQGACTAILLKKQMELPVLKMALKVAQKVPLLLRKILPVANYIMMAADVAARGKRLISLYMGIPLPCPDNEPGAESCRRSTEDLALFLLKSVVAKFASQAILDMATAGGVMTSLETAGLSLIVSIGAYATKVAVNWALEEYLNGQFDVRFAAIATAVDNLNCWRDHPEDPVDPGYMNYNWKPGKLRSFTPKKRPLIDPSGFVCEAVESNRLEGVTATCFYKKEVEDMYGDKHEEVTVWDAENYGQVNPQLTDKDGMYSWMVPTGQWQVLYEKDGYETQRSAWLPVPPPQLDVNVGLVRRAQPGLSDGHAYERAIDIDFSLYMKKNHVTVQTLTFWQDGKQLSGELKAINGETAFGFTSSDDDDEGPQCASSFRFVPKNTLAVGSKVTVRAKSIIRSYADVPIGEDRELTLTVGREVTSIGSDGNIVVPYGGSHQVVLTAKGSSPTGGGQEGAAAAFRQVTVSSLSPDIANVEANRVTLDAEGKAYITVIGRLPGTTYLEFAVEGSQVKGMDTVRVVSNLDFVPAPKASIISGMYVGEGTKVELTAEKGCTIWYTLDGSCPCDESKRQQYTGPITINTNTTLRAMAVDAQGRESEVVTFTWFIGTGINTAVVPKGVEGIYDLQGRKRDVPASGINIINGRKIVK